MHTRDRSLGNDSHFSGLASIGLHILLQLLWAKPQFQHVGQTWTSHLTPLSHDSIPVHYTDDDDDDNNDGNNDDDDIIIQRVGCISHQ